MQGSMSQKGFTFIGILLSVAIVMILVTIALQTYRPILENYGGPSGTSNSLGMDISRIRMRGICQAEFTYYAVHRSYATWDELVRDNHIPGGYSDGSDENGRPFVPGYIVEIEISNTGFVITGTPDPEADIPENLPVLRIDESGRLEEVQIE